MAHKVALLNQKGGTGKTTTAVNLAAALAARGKRVLLIDYDTQGDASAMLGLSQLVEEPNLYSTAQFTLGVGEWSPQRNVMVGGLDVLPTTEELLFIEPQLLRSDSDPYRYLSAAIQAIESEYDWIITDCPPAMGVLSMNAVVACPNVIIPVGLSPIGVRGALRLRRHLESIRILHSLPMRILGVLPTFFRKGVTGSKDTLTVLRDLFGAAMFETVINLAEDVNASSGSAPIVSSKSSSRSAQEYLSFTEEVLARV